VNASFSRAVFISASLIALACGEADRVPTAGSGTGSGPVGGSAVNGNAGRGGQSGSPGVGGTTAGASTEGGEAGSGDAGSAGSGDAGSAGSGSGCRGAQHEAEGPDAWGGCWPGPSNTGVPEGTTLTPYDGPCVITVDDTVIDAKTVACDLQIRAANVRILRSKINGSVATDEASSGYSFDISDSEVDVGDRAGTGIGAVSFSALRVHVRGGNRSIHCWHDCTVTDSYVHGQFTDPSGTFHESAMRMGQSATFRHNTVICDAPDVPPDGGCSAGLTGYGDFGPVQNNVVDRNLFGATTGGFCAYGGSSQGKPYSDQTHHIVFTGNVFQRGERASDHGEFVCGYYGAITAFDASLPGNTWSENTFDDGTPVISSN
jgi:hypothetical protein